MRRVTSRHGFESLLIIGVGQSSVSARRAGEEAPMEKGSRGEKCSLDDIKPRPPWAPAAARARAGASCSSRSSAQAPPRLRRAPAAARARAGQDPGPAQGGGGQCHGCCVSLCGFFTAKLKAQAICLEAHALDILRLCSCHAFQRHDRRTSARRSPPRLCLAEPGLGDTAC